MRVRGRFRLFFSSPLALALAVVVFVGGGARVSSQRGSGARGGARQGGGKKVSSISDTARPTLPTVLVLLELSSFLATCESSSESDRGERQLVESVQGTDSSAQGRKGGRKATARSSRLF